MFRQDLLKGKRILVTGGGTGLGRERASRYMELGGDICICGRRRQVLEDTAGELSERYGRSCSVRAVAIRDATTVDEMVEDFWQEGPLTGLVNNAAGNFISPTKDLSHRGFDAIADIVFHGTFYVPHAVGRRGIENGSGGDWSRIRESIKAHNARDREQRST